MMTFYKSTRRSLILLQLCVLIAPTQLWQRVIAHRQIQSKVYILEPKEPVLPTSNEVSSVDFLPRWHPKGDPLYHRRLETYHFDMCAESLGMPKVALCFLTRGPVHQEALWQEWLKQADGLVLLPDAEGEAQPRDWTLRDRVAAQKACKLKRSIHATVARRQHLFSVYTHPTDPAFKGYRPGSVFHGSQIGNLLPRSSYASYDLVEAARSLLAAALQDRLNQRFVHISESCIPIYPPTLVYMQLVHEKKSRVHVADPSRDVLFDKEWKPVLDTTYGLTRALHWRKGDHWKSLIRKHAQLAVDDEQLVDAFSKDCMKCHVPERYFQVLLAVHGLQNETFPNGWLTWVDWTKLDVTGAHPKDIDSTIIDEELLFIMRTSKMGDYKNVCRGAWDSGAVTSAEGLLHSYVPGSRLWRASNEQGMPVRRIRRAFAALQHECLLFGRKFKPHTISAVLDMFRHPQYATWNYTHERLTPHIYGALEDE